MWLGRRVISWPLMDMETGASVAKVFGIVVKAVLVSVVVDTDCKQCHKTFLSELSHRDIWYNDTLSNDTPHDY
jgi:hypothetical protein